ncbi:MAG: glycosyltransferase family 39 protein [Candidatus Omnitrophota bacterium]
MKGSKQEKAVYLILIFVLALTVILRLYGISKIPAFTIDCDMYMTISEGLYKNPLNYSARDFYERYKKEGIQLPEFLNRPLFVYPPLYCYLIDGSYHLFGLNERSALFVSLFFGCATVLIVFFIAKALYGAHIAIISSALMSIEPINWISSEKVWIETTYVFFASLAVLLFILGLKNRKYLIICGIFLGLSFLSKYQAFLILIVVLGFAFLRRKGLFFKKEFWGMLFISFIMFLPWVIWNIKEKNLNTFTDFFISNYSFSSFRTLFFIFIIALLGGLLLRRQILSSKPKAPIHQNRNIRLLYLTAVFILALFFFVRIMPGILSFKIPSHGFYSGMFSQGSGYFYIVRLIELSPIYLLSFIAFLYYFNKRNEDFILILWAGIVLIFHSLWGNFQSRYVLLAVPALIILASKIICDIYDKIGIVFDHKLKMLYKFFYFLIFTIFLFKNILVSVVLAIIDHPCYF